MTAEARTRLEWSPVAFGVADAARAFASQSARIYLIANIAKVRPEGDPLGLFLLWAGVTFLPMLALAPFMGWCSRHGVRRFTLPLACVLGFFAVIVAFTGGLPVQAVFAVFALESALFLTARFAALGAISRLRPASGTTIWAWFGVAQTLGGFAGIVTAAAIDYSNPAPGLPKPLAFALAGYALAFLFLIGRQWPGLDANAPPEGPFRSFFGAINQVARTPFARRTLISLALIETFLILMRDLVIGPDFFLFGGDKVVSVADRFNDPSVGAMMNFGAALAGGFALASLSRHPFRSSGWGVFVAPLLFLFTLLKVRLGPDVSAWLIGVPVGFVIPGLLATYFNFAPERRVGPAAAVLVASQASVGVVVMALLSIWRTDANDVALEAAFVLAICLAGSIWAVAWLVHLKAGFELFIELLAGGFYKIRSRGPGLDTMPPHGPMLIYANHAAWFDPLWMSKHIPSTTTPMMTARFFDLPVLGWFMRHAVRAIRVAETPVRRETPPELADAIAALDRGEAVVIFPEGYLRRTEAQPLRRFAQGVWKILKERPDTPIYPCWIEGNWGSYFSFKDGPPTKNKNMDRGRLIEIGVTGPRTIDPKILEDHWATRFELMRWILEARDVFGLPPLEVPNMPKEAAEAEQNPEAKE